jgi:hypothetical protein
MKNAILFSILSVLTAAAQAEEKNCTVKGMHCEACTEMVSDKVCNDSYEVCQVTMKDDVPPKGKATREKKGKVGNIHLKTKDAAVKIDEKAIAKAIADTSYKVEKCTPVAKAM